MLTDTCCRNGAARLTAQTLKNLALPGRTAPVWPKRRFFKGCVLGCLLLLSFSRLIFADVPYQHFQFRHLTVDNGLSHSKTYAITEDKVGFMWFATAYGLNRYDGFEFKLFRHQPDDPSSLSGNYVWDLLIDSRGQMWASTWGTGLNLYVPETESFIRYLHNEEDPTSLPANNVWSVYEDVKGRIWVCTEGGLSLFDKQTQQFITYRHIEGDASSLAHNVVTAVEDAPGGMLYIATYGGGLDLFDPETGQVVEHHSVGDNGPLSEDNNIWTLEVLRSGQLWIGSNTGVVLFDADNKRFTPFKRQQISASISDILQDRQGRIWLSSGSGLFLFDPVTEDFRSFAGDPNSRNTINANFLSHSYESNNGIVWISTQFGIAFYDPTAKKFKHYRQPSYENNVISNDVTAIYEDADGILWLGTSTGGLNRFDRRTGAFRYFSTNSKKQVAANRNKVFAIREGKNNELWIATQEGLNRFDKKTKIFEVWEYNSNHPEGISKGYLADIALDAQGKVWLAVNGFGINSYDPQSGHFDHFGPNPNSAGTTVSSWPVTLHFDQEHYLWVGSEGVGVTRFNTQDGGLKAMAQGAILSDKTVNDLYEDSRGTLWIATLDGLHGLNRKNGEIKSYHAEQGMASDSVSAILEDKQGVIWASSTRGLSKLDETTGTIRNYDIDDGLQNNQFLNGAAIKTAAGELAFGGTNGFNIFYPEQIVDNPIPARSVITEIRVNHQRLRPGELLSKPVYMSDRVILSHTESIFGFDFAAFSYNSPTKSQFAYRLDGFDDHWLINDSRTRTATYTNLDPGDYVFEVKATNNDGLWSESAAFINVTILPPPWQSWWAYSVYLLVIVGIAWLLVSFRIRLLNRRQEELEYLVEARTADMKVAVKDAEAANRSKSIFLSSMSHELRTPLNAVLGFSDILRDREEDKEKRSFLNAIHTAGNTLLSLINNVLDLSKIEAGKLELVPTSVSLYELGVELEVLFKQRALDDGIEFSAEVETGIPNGLLLDELHLRQILLNLCSNGIKFTDQGFVRVKFSIKPSTPPCDARVDLTILVEDSGKGIAPDEHDKVFDAFEQASHQNAADYGGTGLGLPISKRLVDAMNGRIILDSDLDSGSRFMVELRDVDIAHDSMAKVEDDDLDYGTIVFAQARLLIADDVSDNRELIKLYLLTWGFHIIEAASGQEVLDWVAQEKPDLILLDMKMPGMDGYETSERLNANPSTRHIPIVAVTASALTQDEVVIRENCHDFLSKPLSKAALIRCLMRFLPYSIKENEVSQINPSALSRAPASSKSLVSAARPVRVLAVDDNQVNLLAVRAMLKELEAEAVVVNNGKEAVEIFRRELHNPFDMILMDCDMPEMDGFQTAEQIYRVEESSAVQRRTPIIYLTAYDLSELRRRAQNREVEGYIAKPLSLQRLSEVLQQYSWRSKEPS